MPQSPLKYIGLTPEEQFMRFLIIDENVLVTVAFLKCSLGFGLLDSWTAVYTSPDSRRNRTCYSCFPKMFARLWIAWVLFHVEKWKCYSTVYFGHLHHCGVSSIWFTEIIHGLHGKRVSWWQKNERNHSNSNRFNIASLFFQHSLSLMW